MLNCQQVKSIYAATQEELQDLVNEQLRKLGKRVQQIDFVNPLCEGFRVNIIYWSQDIASTMTCKLEELSEEPEATDESKLFVLVLHDCQRDLVKTILTKERLLNENCYTDKQIGLMERTIQRFDPEDIEEQLE